MSLERRQSDRRRQSLPVQQERRSGQRRQRERRQSARVPLDLWVEEERGNELYLRRTGNISAGGISFEQAIPHAAGSRIRIRFALPSTPHVIETTAEIVNTKASDNELGMGLQFVDMPSEAQKNLAAFLAQLG